MLHQPIPLHLGNAHHFPTLRTLETSIYFLIPRSSYLFETHFYGIRFRILKTEPMPITSWWCGTFEQHECSTRCLCLPLRYFCHSTFLKNWCCWHVHMSNVNLFWRVFLIYFVKPRNLCVNYLVRISTQD